MAKALPDELPSNLRAVLRSAVRNGVHRCVAPAASQLNEWGLVDIISLSDSGATCEVMPTEKGREYPT